MRELTIRLSPVKSIRKYCKTVCAGSPKETRLCPVSECPLYEFRGGKNLARAGIGGRQRGKEGRFLQKKSHTTGPDLIMTPKEGADMGQAVRAHHGSTMREFGGSEIEETKGQIRIEKTSSGLLIRLTQVPH